MTSRRQYLAALGGGLGFLSGCSGRGESSDTPTATPNGTESRDPPTEIATVTATDTATETDATDTATESRTPTPEETDSPEPDTDEPTSTPEATESTEPETGGAVADIVLEDVVVRKAVTYEYMLGSTGMLIDADQQYVVATVRSVEDPRTTSFTFDTGEESFDPGVPGVDTAPTYAVADHGGGPGWDRRALDYEDPNYLVFTVPSPLAATNPRIRAAGDGTAEWHLSKTARERLGASAPRFTLDAFDAPENVTVGDPFTVTLTVTNITRNDGRFLAAAYWPTEVHDDDESHVFEREVGTRETVTMTKDIPTEYTEYHEGEATLSVEGYVEAEQTVRVQEPSASD